MNNILNHSIAIFCLEKEISNCQRVSKYYRWIIRRGKKPSGVYGTEKQKEKIHKEFVAESKESLKKNLETIKDLKRSLRFLQKNSTPNYYDIVVK